MALGWPESSPSLRSRKAATTWELPSSHGRNHKDLWAFLLVTGIERMPGEFPACLEDPTPLLQGSDSGAGFTCGRAGRSVKVMPALAWRSGQGWHSSQGCVKTGLWITVDSFSQAWVLFLHMYLLFLSFPLLTLPPFSPSVAAYLPYIGELDTSHPLSYCGS